MIQFIVQLTSLWVISVVAKIRFNVLIWFLNFLMIVLINVRRIKFISLVIYIRLFIILCHFMHFISSYIEWWILKSLTNKYSLNLLNSYYKLYMRKFLLTFCKNLENNKYILWMYNVMFFSLKVSNKRSDFEYFII